MNPMLDPVVDIVNLLRHRPVVSVLSTGVDVVKVLLHRPTTLSGTRRANQPRGKTANHLMAKEPKKECHKKEGTDFLFL